MQFNEKLIFLIDKYARKWPTDYSCVKVQLAVMDELGFATTALRLCGRIGNGNYAGIREKIDYLADIALIDKRVVAYDGDRAQEYVNTSFGEWIVLAYINAYLPGKILKSHAGIVIPGIYAGQTGPAIGGGGMTQKQINKGWHLSNARIHFTALKAVKYFKYSMK
jgi:hypothetical protein